MEPKQQLTTFIEYELNAKQRQRLEAKLKKADFRIEEMGHVHVENVTAPVGFLTNGNQEVYRFTILGLDQEHLHQYTSELKGICDKLR